MRHARVVAEAGDGERGGRGRRRDANPRLAAHGRGTAVSLTVSDCVPAVLRVAVKVCAPASAP